MIIVELTNILFLLTTPSIQNKTVLGHLCIYNPFFFTKENSYCICTINCLYPSPFMTPKKLIFYYCVFFQRHHCLPPKWRLCVNHQSMRCSKVNNSKMGKEHYRRRQYVLQKIPYRQLYVKNIYIKKKTRY